MGSTSRHSPVLLGEVLEWLTPRPRGVYVDGTVGAGGHAEAIAREMGEGGLVLGLDRDPAMLRLAAERTRGTATRLFHAAYDQLPEVLSLVGIKQVDGLVLDLGFSSDQIAWSQRGFSFAVDGPLDMRFDPESGGITAETIINTWEESALANLFFRYGEERYSRRIARGLVRERAIQPIRGTSQLAELIRRRVPRGVGRIDPATRVFQALRIQVNDELKRLEWFLEHFPEMLVPGGRACLISFHSLEDRLVKVALRRDPRLLVHTKKPITATPAEVAENPRARSAKLRVAERCLEPTGTHPTTASPPARNPSTG